MNRRDFMKTCAVALAGPGVLAVPAVAEQSLGGVVHVGTAKMLTLEHENVLPLGCIKGLAVEWIRLGEPVGLDWYGRIHPMAGSPFNVTSIAEREGYCEVTARSDDPCIFEVDGCPCPH